MKVSASLKIQCRNSIRRVFRIFGVAVMVAIAFPTLSYGANCSATSVGFTPINDLGAGSYLGFQGGLYPGGANLRPASHNAAGLALARSIGPMNGNGNPDANGKYVLLSIGMSNANMEFDAFLPRANADPDKDTDLVVVNGAQGGATAAVWSEANNPVWTNAMQQLSQQGVNASQVAVVWAKLANRAGGQTPEAYRTGLQNDAEGVIRNLYDKFPNLKLVYLTSRIYAGYATSTLNPEPQSYESGFVVKWAIEKQLDGDASLNFDPANGAVNAPWLSWGPYLWADGLRPRNDGLTWECDDLDVDDGTHPSAAGMQKVATLLLGFFKTDATAREWFLGDPSTPVDTIAPLPPQNLIIDP